MPCELTAEQLASATVVEPELCGDDLNGGCNSTPPVFTEIVNGDIIHGMAWAFDDGGGGTRDTDWYRLVLDGSDDVDMDGMVDVHFNILGELPVVSFLIQDDVPTCGGDLPGFGSTAYSQTCTQVGQGFASVPATGTYFVFAGTGNADGGGVFDGFPCGGPDFGNDYLLCVNVVDTGGNVDPTCPPGGAAGGGFPACEPATPTCPWDCADQNGTVNTVDFLALLGQWGDVGTSCDFDNNGVNTVDFLALLGNWGDCPP